MIIPTCGRWSLLRETLPTALDQREVEIEVVIVDDGSADETPDRLAEIDDPRVRVRRHPRRKGLAASRNEAVALAQGEWVAFLDDDDLWAPDNLRRKLTTLERTGADFAYSGVILIDEANTPLYRFEAPDPETILVQLLQASVIPGGPSNLVVRTSLGRSIGWFDEEFEMLEDWDLFIRLAATGHAAACDETLVAYRRHGRNMSGDARFDPSAAFQRLTGKHSALAACHGVRFDAARVARWAAGERRRRLVLRAERESERGRRAVAVFLFLASAVKHRRRQDLRRAVIEAAPRFLRPERGDAARRAPGPAVEPPAWLTQPRDSPGLGA